MAVVTTNVTLRALIEAAYSLAPSAPLAGLPAWADADRFDIVAKAPGNVNDRIHSANKDGGAKDKVATPQSSGPAGEQLMLRALLEERFKLAAHVETRDQAIYALTLAKSDRRPGPRLLRSALDCAADAPKAAKGAACGIKTAPGKMTARGSTMAQIAASLSQAVHRTVSDRTALTGTFDADLAWAADDAAPASSAHAAGKADPNGVSVFTAIEEQLGLRLESARGTADVLVIDHAERPTAD